MLTSRRSLRHRRPLVPMVARDSHSVGLQANGPLRNRLREHVQRSTVKQSHTAAAHAHGISHICTNLDEMLAAGVDSARVLIAPQLHADRTCQILDAGVHASAKKRMDLDSSSCDEIATLAETRRAQLRASHNVLSLTPPKQLRQQVRDRTIDRLDPVELRAGYTRSDRRITAQGQGTHVAHAQGSCHSWGHQGPLTKQAPRRALSTPHYLRDLAKSRYPSDPPSHPKCYSLYSRNCASPPQRRPSLD